MNTLVACAAASSGVISTRDTCIGFFDVGASVNCHTFPKPKFKRKTLKKGGHLVYLDIRTFLGTPVADAQFTLDKGLR